MFGSLTRERLPTMSSDIKTARLLRSLDVIAPPAGWVERAVERYEGTTTMNTAINYENHVLVDTIIGSRFGWHRTKLPADAYGKTMALSGLAAGLAAERETLGWTRVEPCDVRGLAESGASVLVSEDTDVAGVDPLVIRLARAEAPSPPQGKRAKAVWELLPFVAPGVDVRWVQGKKHDRTAYRATYQPVGYHADRINIMVETTPGEWHTSCLTAEGINATGELVYTDTCDDVR